MLRNSLSLITAGVYFFSATAYAAGSGKAPFYVIIQDLESNAAKKIPAKLTESGYVYDFYDQGLAVPVKGVIVESNDLGAPIKQIDLSQTTSIAVSDEGPWQPLFALDKNSDWTKLDYPKNAHSFTLALPERKDDFSRQPLHASQTQIVGAAKKIDYGMDSSKRWISLAEKCDEKSNDNPCYSYISKQKLRLTLANDEVILLTIEYPGGC